jgi:transcriptional regulator with XRE-family HTH domain
MRCRVVSTDHFKAADKEAGHAISRKPGRKAAERDGSEVSADPVLAHVGQQVLAARQRLGLTQEQLAEKAGCAAATVFLVENARRNATIRSLSTLAGALGVEVADLFPRSGAASTKRRFKGSTTAIADEVSRAREALSRIERLAQEFDDEDKS